MGGDRDSTEKDGNESNSRSLGPSTRGREEELGFDYKEKKNEKRNSELFNFF